MYALHYNAPSKNIRKQGKRMSLTSDEIKKIAHLARLTLTQADIDLYASQLTRILDFVEQMNQLDTSEIEPLAHPLELSQRLRPDSITEIIEREKYQKLAPLVEAGLYLVPKVIDEA